MDFLLQAKSSILSIFITTLPLLIVLVGLLIVTALVKVGFLKTNDSLLYGVAIVYGIGIGTFIHMY